MLNWPSNSNCLIDIPLLTTSSTPRTKSCLLLINFEILPLRHLTLGRFSSCINPLTGFYMRAKLAFNGFKPHHSHAIFEINKILEISNY